ncbi:MAG: phage minor head protein [Aristaeellaceae bacterium]
MRIRELRTQLGITQSEFAARYSIPFRTVQNWEAEVRKAIYMAKCERCRKRGIFLKLNRDGLCGQCAHEICEEAAKTQQPISKPKEEPVLTVAEKMSIALQKELIKDNLGKNIFGEIKSFGNEYSFQDDVYELIALLAYRSTISGERPETLTDELLDMMPDLEREAVLSLMRTKCAIASSARVKFRSLSLKCEWYIWRTARDGDRVRGSHRLMEGVICNWNDPPNPQKLLDGSAGHLEHPGYATECRCIALTVLGAEDIKLPARVHVHGEIKEISNSVELADMLKKN